jgi:hypothetical protein
MDDRPILVMSAGLEAPLDDSLSSKDRQMVQEDADDMDRLEIEEALDTWLGEDLQSAGLWGGERQIRQATEEEAARWRAALNRAREEGEADEDDDNWLAFLVEPPAGFRFGSIRDLP